MELGNNRISWEGIRHLVHCQLGKLGVLYLGVNHIGSKGCKMLSQVQWDSLTKLSVSKKWVSQATTK